MTIRTVARLVRRSAPIFEDFGRDYAARLFGQEAIDSLPLYQRGKNAGKPKAWLHWVKAEAGGWSHEFGVCRPGLVWAYIGATINSTRDGALVGQWIGRPQTLSGSRSVLTQAYRDEELNRRSTADGALCDATQ